MVAFQDSQQMSMFIAAFVIGGLLAAAILALAVWCACSCILPPSAKGPEAAAKAQAIYHGAPKPISKRFQEAAAATRVGVSPFHTDPRVRVLPSRYLAASGHTGSGLYASRPFKASQVIVEYRGEVLSCGQASLRTDRTYMMLAGGGPGKRAPGQLPYYIDALCNAKASPAKYVNSPVCRDDQNCTFRSHRGRVFLCADQNIEAGEELLAWYGADTAVIIA